MKRAWLRLAVPAVFGAALLAGRTELIPAAIATAIALVVLAVGAATTTIIIIIRGADQ